MNVPLDDAIDYSSIDLILEKQDNRFEFKGALNIEERILQVSITQFNRLNNNEGVKINIDDHIITPGNYESKFRVIDVNDYLSDRRYVEYKVQKIPQTRTR